MASIPQPPKFLSVHNGFAAYHPVAHLSLEETIDLIDKVILYCRTNEIAGLLVNITDITGFPSPSITERFWFIRKWAETSGGKVTLAMVANPDMIMPDKIGVTMALNRGLRTDVFSDEGEALEWIRTECLV